MTPQEAVKEMLDFITTECDEVNVDQQYNDMLDECYTFDKVGGPFEHMLPSRVLEETDPVAYRCGKVDCLDSMRDEWVEIGSDCYYNKRDVDKAQDEWIDEHLTDPISELEDEIEDLESDNDGEHDSSPNGCHPDCACCAEEGALREKLANLEACLKACEKYAF